MAGVSADHDFDCSNFFDQFDDLLDIPDETCNIDNAESDFLFDNFKDFPTIWTPSDEFAIENAKDVFSENNSNHSASDLSLPYEDIAQLEWLSVFVDDSFSAGDSLTIDVPNVVPSAAAVSHSPTRFQTTSPVSVLESSSSSYAGGKFMPVSVKPAMPSGGRCGRARSERPRPSTFKRRVVSPSGSFSMSGSSEGESYGDFCNNVKIRKSGSSTEHKKKRIKLSSPADVDQNENPNPLAPVEGEVRKCQHCEITKTPQWRAGPNGPKTLCNACGVRYKSGRLFPEYRPAASPTFVPSIHSNSHKKVLEMRVKTSCNMADFPLIEDSSCRNPLADYM